MMKMFTTFSTSIILMSVALCFAPVTHAKSSPPSQPESAILSHSDLSPQLGNRSATPGDDPTNPNDPIPSHFPSVNKYIIDHHLPHSKVVKDPRMDSLPKLAYKHGTYMGVVIHEVGVDHQSLQQWVDNMYKTYTTAFVHAFVDNNEIHITAPSEYYVWGCGAKANPYFYQIEVVRMYTFEDFAKSVNNQAWLAAYMLKQNGIPPILADDNEGKGSVISHNGVSRYWGGTDHVDPIAYYARWGYDMHQMLELIKYHYNHM